MELGTGSLQGSVVPLTPSNAINICDILKSSGFSNADWESLAPRLGVMDTKSIWTVHPRDPFLCLYDVIRQWLHSDPQATWEKLANKVSKVEGYGANTAQTILGNAATAPPTSAPSLQVPPPSSPTSPAPSFESHPHLHALPLHPLSKRRKLGLLPGNESSHPHLHPLSLPSPSKSYLHPSPPQPPPSSPTSAPSLRELSHLPVTRWYLLGLQLGVDQHELEVIERDYPQNNYRCKLKMFGVWLRTDPSATYKKLVRGLTAIGQRNMAESLCNAQGIPLSVLSDVAPRPPTPPPIPQQPPAPPQCIADYASFLKDKYQRMDTLPDSDWPPSIGRQYTRLAMIEIKRGERLPDAEFANTMEQDYLHGKIDNICGEKQGIELEQAFLPLRTGEGQLKILMDGAPGVGKTTLSRKACKDWASGKLLWNYHLVVLLPLREKGVKNAQTLEDLFYADDKQLQQEVVQHIRQTSGDHLLLICDGYDELSFKQRTEDSLFLDIIQGKQLFRCSILVTSRPYASGHIQELQCINRHVEVLGFTKEQIQECIKQNILLEAEATALSKSLQERLDITSLCYTPLNCAIMLYVYKQEQYTLPVTLTKLFEKFVLNTLRRHTRNTNDLRTYESMRTLDNLPPSLKDKLNALSKVAYTGLAEDESVFQKEEIPSCTDTDFETSLLGLMTSVKSFTSSGREMHYQFLHLSIQEYLAARWVATQLATKPEDQAKIFHSYLDKNRFQMMLLFLAGLSELKFASSSKIFASSIQFAPSGIFGDHTVIRRLLFLVHLIFESQHFSLYHTLSNAVTDRNLNLSSYKFSLFDCFLLAKFLDESACSWETLDLSNCDLTEAVWCAVENILKVNTTLKVLKLSGCGVTDTEIKNVTAGLAENISAKSLDVSLNNISSAGAEAIFRSLEHNTTLEELNMSYNRQPKDGDSEAVGCAVERMLTVNTTLKALKLRMCGITDTVVKHMAAGLAQNKSVKTLVISYNIINRAGAEAIFRSLEHNNSLEEVDMSYNRQLTEGNGEAVEGTIVRMLKVNTILKVLKMDHCGLDTTVMKRIATEWRGTLYYCGVNALE